MMVIQTNRNHGQKAPHGAWAWLTSSPTKGVEPEQLIHIMNDFNNNDARVISKGMSSAVLSLQLCLSNFGTKRF